MESERKGKKIVRNDRQGYTPMHVFGAVWVKWGKARGKAMGKVSAPSPPSTPLPARHRIHPTHFSIYLDLKKCYN